MKKESKGRYKVSEQLSDKTSALIMIASGISVLLLMIYFGVSLTSKGTFSASNLTCASGTIMDGHICCQQGYGNPVTVNTTGIIVPIVSQLAVGGNVCTNNFYSTADVAYISNGVAYCVVSGSLWDTQEECESSNGNYDNDVCHVPCAVSPSEFEIGDNCVTDTGVSGVIDSNYTCAASLDDQRLAPSTGCYRCEIYGAGQVYQYFVIGAELPDYCADERSDNYEYNGTSCQLKGSSNTCSYSIRNAGTDEVSIVTTQSCCSDLSENTTWDASSQTCKYPVSSTTSYYYYDNLGFDNWCSESNMYHEWNNKCITCKSGYSPDDTQGCIESSNTSNPKTVTITFKNDDGSDITTRSCTIPAGSTACPSDIVFPGAQTSSSGSGYTFNGWGDRLGCTEGSYTANGTLHITRDSSNRTYYACYSYVPPVTSSNTFNISSCSYSPWSVVTRDQNHLNCIYTNITYGTNQGQGTTGDVQACCTQKGYTWVGENYTSSGYGNEYCIICGTGGQSINADRCIKSSATIKKVVSCDLTASQIAGISCNGSDTSTAQGMCTLSDGTRVPRCDVADVNNSHCTSSSTETITCYYCDSNNTRRSYTSDTGACDNSSYPSATTNSNLVCSSSSVTCYRCTANSTTVSEEEFDGDSCPSGWSTTRPTCSKSCNYCENNTKKTDNNVPKEKACSAYNSNYHETSEALDCSGQKKTCYKCNSETVIPDTQQVDQNANCPSGWSTTVPTCSKSCNYCENNTKKTDNNVPKGKTCSAYNSNYHETSEALDCSPAKTTCYYCEGTSRKSFTLETSANGNCANSTAHPGATNNSNLKCVEEVKCCACEGTNKVTKGDSTNGKCPSGQTICSELVCKNSQTGTSAIVIAWLVGIIAIGYSFYYFRKTNKQQ